MINDNTENFYKMLEGLKPVNILDKKTTKKQALELYSSILRTFAKFEVNTLDFGSGKKLEEMLKNLGCLSLDVSFDEIAKIHPDFLNDNKTITEAINDPEDLGFPINVVQNAIKNYNSTMKISFGPDNWCDRWVKNYDAKKDEIETL